MKTAGAIVTDRGGRTCHAAIVARELGVPAVVGSEAATSVLQTGADASRCPAPTARSGSVYDGDGAVRGDAAAGERAANCRAPQIMLNLGNPDLAFRTAMLPNDGVGLARMEFIISEHIGVHPMALVHPETIAGGRARAHRGAEPAMSRRRSEFFVRTLAEGVGTIAAAFYPKPVIVRLSDFKTNEYAELLGGARVRTEGGQSDARLPRRVALHASRLRGRLRARMRGAAAGARDDGADQPEASWCRSAGASTKAEQVIEAMAKHGLERGEDGLEVYVMCEIPNNVIQVDAFAEIFDGFSIGSNDLTQLTLGVDRDSEIVAFDFDERDAGMLEMLRLAVTGASATTGTSAFAARRRRTIRRSPSFLAGSGSIRSASIHPASLARSQWCARRSVVCR